MAGPRARGAALFAACGFTNQSHAASKNDLFPIPYEAIGLTPGNADVLVGIFESFAPPHEVID
jgi:hypothetical protein